MLRIHGGCELSILLDTWKKCEGKEAVYPAECDAFSEACMRMSQEDNDLISDEYLFVFDRSMEFAVPMSTGLIEQCEPDVVETFTSIYGRA